MVAELVELSAEQRNLPPAAYKKADLSRRAAGRIIALMDESLILSACTGESREFCHEMKGDSYQFFAGFTTGDAKSKVAEEAMDVPTVSQRQAPMIQKVLKTVEVMTQEIVDRVAGPHHEYVDVPYANPIVQTAQKTVEVPQVQYLGQINNVSLVMQCQIPTIQAVQETMEVPHVHFLDPEVDVPVMMQKRGAAGAKSGASR